MKNDVENDVNLEGIVLVFAAASLTSLGFLATNCSVLRAGMHGQGELGLQQVNISLATCKAWIHALWDSTLAQMQSFPSDLSHLTRLRICYQSMFESSALLLIYHFMSISSLSRENLRKTRVECVCITEVRSNSLHPGNSSTRLQMGMY
jgi:hypothetical protein